MSSLRALTAPRLRELDLARPAVVDIAAVALIALVAWAYLRASALPNWDNMYAFVWGRDLLEGRLPVIESGLTPTPHPLAIVASAALAAFGEEFGYQLFVAAGFAAFATAIWCTFRVGQLAFSWRVGVVAAVVLATSLNVLHVALVLVSVQDVGFLALVLAAAVVELRRPKDGGPVLVLLALAGLLRPEAWLLAAAYWVYFARTARTRARVYGALLVLAAPALWGAFDVVTSGDAAATYDVTHAEALEPRQTTGVANVPSELVDGLRRTFRPPVVVGAAAGFALALAFARRAARLPAALLVLGVVAFAILGAAGLPLIDRFLLVPIAMVAVFFGYAALGWWRAGRPSRVGLAVGLLALAALVPFLPSQVDSLRAKRDDGRVRAEVASELRDVLARPDTRALVERCRPLVAAAPGLIPYLAQYTGRRPDEVAVLRERPAARGVVVAPTTPRVEQLTGLSPVVAPPPGAVPARRTRYWAVYRWRCA